MDNFEVYLFLQNIKVDNPLNLSHFTLKFKIHLYQVRTLIFIEAFDL